MMEREPERFDVIVTDYAMPLISGVDVIRFARNMRSGWPAVMITGYADSGEISARPSDVPLVVKPFTHQALISAIKNVAGDGS